MRIAFFTDTYQPDFSGVETSIDSFKKELEAQGHTVFIFAPFADEKKNTKRENDQGIYRLQAANQLFFPEFKMTFPISKTVVKNFGSFEFDVIHSQTPFMMGLYANLVGFALNIPVIHTYHTFYEKYSGHSFVRSREKIDQFLTSVIKQITVLHSGRCDHILVPSEKMKKVLTTYGIAKKLSVLPTGLDLAEFKDVDQEAFRKKYHISEDEKIILYVGRIAPEKNLTTLLKAYRQVKKKVEKTRLVLVGDGPDMKELKKFVDQEKMNDDVLFLGHKKRKEVLEIFAGSNIFAFASLTDTQSLSLCEAVASGLPVVMMKDEGLINVVKNGINGLVAENQKEFSEDIIEILSNPEAEQKFRTNAKKLIKEYNVKTLTKKLVAIYKETIDSYSKQSIRSKVKRSLSKEIQIKEMIDKKKNKELIKKLKERTRKLLNAK